MRLADLQLSFWQAVRTRGTPPSGLDTWLTRSARQTATERLAVYHHAYWQRQVATLADTFPKTQAQLGQARTERLMLAYIEGCPGTDPCIERLGAGFVEFLAASEGVDEIALGVARLEWAWVVSLLARDAVSVSELPRDLGTRLAECRIEFVPALQLEHVPTAAFRLFDADALASAHANALTAAQVDVAFFRPAFAVKYRALQADEATAHKLAAGGATFALICAAFSELAPELSAPRALQVLSSWFARGWVAKFSP